MCVKIFMFVMAICLSQVDLARSQQTYIEVDKESAISLAVDFGANRERFGTYSCMMDTSHHYSVEDQLQSVSRIRCVFDDPRKKWQRDDISIEEFHGDGVVRHPHLTVIRKRGDQVVLEGANKMSADFANAMKSRLFVPDPWMYCISELSVVNRSLGGGSTYWFEVFDPEKLLWAEESSNYVRGEWKFGDGEFTTYLQVYFSKSMGGMPVLSRYILPADKDIRFAKQGKRFVSEIDVKWEKISDRWRPVECRHSRSNLWSKTGKIRSSEWMDTKFYWDSKFLNSDGEIDDRVYIADEISWDQIRDSF